MATAMVQTVPPPPPEFEFVLVLSEEEARAVLELVGDGKNPDEFVCDVRSRNGAVYPVGDALRSVLEPLS